MGATDLWRKTLARELDNLIDQWTQSRGLGTVRAEDEVFYFVFDSAYEVALSQAGARIYMSTDICDIPEKKETREELLSKVMKMQLARSLDSIDTIARVPGEDRLVLYRRLEAPGLSQREFERVLSDFVNSAAHWVKNTSTTVTQMPAIAPMQMQVIHP